ncbi:putative CYC2-like protein [Leishmania mexicana MHOM/GT/2001/U1103]|uniref:CYC2-like protein n=1 Tax=Leishmania mexicana (strain MHOM/GT/2001/U1103) TaxID=929439 RepID=E9B1D7_LEIMU|nr:putative CYC2-like protein [Leishmania mexicana MHOM/GT/2001/U1103]CBZ29043.1 putative CYC2-like protein [Leishmania mexicana MHOM/GT/2001/U1103]
MSLGACVSRTPAQTRLVEVVSGYVQHLMDVQASRCAETSLDGHVVPPPDAKYPSHDFFCATHVPGISVKKYTDRLVTYMHCSPEAFVFAVAYLRRLVLNGFPVHMRSIHRLLLTAVLVALKCRDDVYYHMSFYAEVGGVTSKDLCIMEIRFLSDLILFEGEVSLENYHTVMVDIMRVTERCMITNRGNKTELCSRCGVSAGAFTASTPGDLGCLHCKGDAFAHTWTSECELFWGPLNSAFSLPAGDV